MATRIDPALVENSPGTPSGSPTGLQKPTTTTTSSGKTQIEGTDGNDVFTLTDIQKDSDHVIKTGLGDDVFRFNGSESARNAGDLNGIVKFGGAAPGTTDNDQVVLGYQISDYVFTLRSEGGIKIQYTGSDPSHPVDGSAVTFYGADVFTFRGASDTPGDPTLAPHSFTYDQLKQLILDSSTVPTA